MCIRDSSGTVSQTGEDLEIKTTLGAFRCHTGSGDAFAVGDPLDMVISADLVQISLENPNTQNSLRCRFISEEFVVAIVTLFAELEDGSDFKVQTRHRDLAILSLGVESSFFVSWSATDAHLIGAK